MSEKETKERIIEVTTKMIEQSDGDIDSITARNIAKESEVGLGLINYHFGSKDNLITIAVQRIIQGVVSGYHVKHQTENLTEEERLSMTAQEVFSFLYQHPAISRISILGDMKDYRTETNSVKTQLGFASVLKESSLSQEEKQFLCFVLTSAMQVAFLTRDSSKNILGYDFTKEEDRNHYIERLVSLLYHGKESLHE